MGAHGHTWVWGVHGAPAVIGLGQHGGCWNDDGTTGMTKWFKRKGSVGAVVVPYRVVLRRRVTQQRLRSAHARRMAGPCGGGSRRMQCPGSTHTECCCTLVWAPRNAVPTCVLRPPACRLLGQSEEAIAELEAAMLQSTTSMTVRVRDGEWERG